MITAVLLGVILFTLWGLYLLIWDGDDGAPSLVSAALTVFLILAVHGLFSLYGG